MLNPLLLWFLPLALAPIILHLITLYRLRTMELPTFRFLMDSYIQQRRRIKLLDFLLMLLRTAFVALIVLALSRPVLRRFGWLGGQTGRDVWIVVDAGASMGLRTGGTTSLERAQAAAAKIVELLSPDDHVSVVRADDKPEAVITRSAGQKQPIIEAINRLRPGASCSNMAAALEEVLNSPRRGTRTLYVLTDASRRAWAPLSGHPMLLAGRDDPVAILNVGPTEPIINLAVTGDPPRQSHAIVGLPVLLSATILNGSPSLPKDTALTVMLDEQQVSQIPMTLQPGQKVTKAVSVTPTRPGAIRGRFQLPADAFPDDDAYLFCLNVEPKASIVIVTGPPTPPPAPTAAADPPDLFLRSALASPLSADAGPAADMKTLAASLDIATTPFSALTDAQLAAADVVILANAPVDPILGARLRKFVTDGGGLIVFPGLNVQQDLYNTSLLSPPGAPGAPGVPGIAGAAGTRGPTLLPPIGNPDDEARFQPLTAIDLSHPIFAAFAEPGAEYFGTTRVYRYFPIKLPDGGGGPAAGEKPTVLIRLPDRTPVLVEMRIGSGRVLLAGVPATPDWSNFPLKPEFVPVLLRAVAHVRREAPAAAPPSVKPREPAPVYLTDRWPDAKVEAIDPAGKPAAVVLHRAGRQMVGAFTETDRKGYYTFRVTPHLAGALDRVELGLAVNLDTGGADFTALTESQLRDVLRPMTATCLRGSANDPELIRQLTQNREFWRSLIWMTFAVIVVEFLLATLRPSGARKQSPGVTPPGPAARRGRLGRLTDRISSVLTTAETE